MSLSRRLKEETSEIHVQAERSPFMQRVLKGTVSREGYADLLGALEVVYEALEEALEGAPEPVGRLHPPELRRSGALARDRAFFGASDADAPPAARALADRIEEVAGRSGDGVRLLAHAWVRYLGDLSGGQLLGRLVRRAFELEGGEGTAFYAFPGIDDPEAFKEEYRRGLDALELEEERVRAAVEEALGAFELHRSLFQELEEREVARTG